MKTMVDSQGKEYAVVEFLECIQGYTVYVIEAETNTADEKLCYFEGPKPELRPMYMLCLEHTIKTKTNELENVSAPKGFNWK